MRFATNTNWQGYGGKVTLSYFTQMAALRRTAPSGGGEPLETGELSADVARRVVTIAGREVRQTPTKYDILRVLVSHAGRALTHDQVLREVWGACYEREAHMLRVNISNLSRKIESNPSRPREVVTEPGLAIGWWPRSRSLRSPLRISRTNLVGCAPGKATACRAATLAPEPGCGVRVG